jgi:hypothetical protein
MAAVSSSLQEEPQISAGMVFVVLSFFLSNLSNLRLRIVFFLLVRRKNYIIIIISSSGHSGSSSSSSSSKSSANVFLTLLHQLRDRISSTEKKL